MNRADLYTLKCRIHSLKIYLATHEANDPDNNLSLRCGTRKNSRHTSVQNSESTLEPLLLLKVYYTHSKSPRLENTYVPSRCQRAIELVDDMVAKGWDVDSPVWSAAIRAAAREQQHTKVSVFYDMARVQPHSLPSDFDASTFVHVMEARKQIRQWDGILPVIEDATRAGVNIGPHGFNLALEACAQLGDWKRALSYLDEMEAEHGSAADQGSIALAMAAADQGKQYSWVKLLLDEMEERGFQPEKSSVRLAIRAYVETNEFSEARALQENTQACWDYEVAERESSDVRGSSG